MTEKPFIALLGMVSLPIGRQTIPTRSAAHLRPLGMVSPPIGRQTLGGESHPYGGGRISPTLSRYARPAPSGSLGLGACTPGINTKKTTPPLRAKKETF